MLFLADSSPREICFLDLWHNVVTPSLSFVVVSYLLGSIPFGYLLVRIFRGQDVRQTGSGNIGATNVARTGSKGLAIATLLLDALKGYIAVAIAAWLPVHLAIPISRTTHAAFAYIDPLALSVSCSRRILRHPRPHVSHLAALQGRQGSSDRGGSFPRARTACHSGLRSWFSWLWSRSLATFRWAAFWERPCFPSPRGG